MSRTHKIKGGYGINNFYKFYKSKYNKVDEKTYKKIIDEFNQIVIDNMLNEGLNYIIPFLNLELTIRKDKRKPKIKNGKLINNRPVDFKATNKLWKENPEAKEKKLLIRHNNSHTSGYVFRIYCKKFKSPIKNRSLLKFRPMRGFKRALAKRINNTNKDNFDCFLLYENK